MSYLIGIDVGGTKIAYGLFDKEKKLLSKTKVPTNTKLYPEIFFDIVIKHMYSLIGEKSVQFEEVDAIGIGMPSFIDFKKGYVVKTASIPLIRDFALRDYLREKLGSRVKIVIDNDGNTGALAEFRYGVGRGFEHIVFCLVSTGIGSSFIINKTLFRGTYGWAGESGHMLVTAPSSCDYFCGCDNSCINSMCSGKMILNHIIRWINNGEKTILTELAGEASGINAKHINEAYELGDVIAVKAVEQMAKYMAIWLYNIYLTLNINCFVFSGGLLAMGDKLFDRIKKIFDQYNKSDYPVYFFETELGTDTGIIGAMELCFLAQ